MIDIVKKSILLYFIVGMVCALVSFAGGAAFGITFGLTMYTVYVIMMFGEGGGMGEHGCMIRDSQLKLQAEGKSLDDKTLLGIYNPTKAAITCACIALPLFLVALANLIFADPGAVYENKLGVITRILYLPEAGLTRFCTESIKTDISGAISAGKAAVGVLDYGSMDFEGMLNATSRIGAYTYATDVSALTIMRILYLPAGLLPYAAYMVGYLQGPRLREKTLKEMMKGSRKKKKKLKVFGNVVPKGPAKPEV